MKNVEKSPFSYFFTLGFVLFFHAFLLVAVVLETLKREKFARLSSAFCVTFCLFRLSSQSRPHNLHKIHGKMGKKLTLSRPWTTASVTVRAETRIYSGHHNGHAVGRAAATRTPGCEYASHLALRDSDLANKREKRKRRKHERSHARTNESF